MTALVLARVRVVRPVLRMLAARVAQAAGTALVLATLCFAALAALPGDAALRVAAARVGEDRLTPELVERIRREDGLDRPLPTQYAIWLGRLLSGELGRSLVTRKPVVEELAWHARFTAALGALGWALSYLVALPLGVAAGLRPGGVLDRVTEGASALLASLPPFLVGIGLVSVFALTLRWLPPAGFGTPGHVLLPAATLALTLAAYSVRVVRDAVAAVATAPWLVFSRVRGLSPASAFLRHGARNAAIPVVTFAALQGAAAVDGFVVVETLFAYPGLGALLVKSLLAHDIPVVLGAGLLMGGLYALFSAAADGAVLWLDPQRRAA